MASSQAAQRYRGANDLLGVTEPAGNLIAAGEWPRASPFQAFVSIGGSKPSLSPSASSVRQYQPPASLQTIPELRQQQADFAAVRRELDWRNRYFAYPALATVVAVAAAEAPAALLAKFATPLLRRIAFDFPELEPWQLPRKPSEPATPAPTYKGREGAIRKEARRKLATANGVAQDELFADAHHSLPLEYADIFPKADPNRLANLWALRPEAHRIASREWTAFREFLAGRLPSQAEVMAKKLRIDPLVAPYLRRPGVSRSYASPKNIKGLR